MGQIDTSAYSVGAAIGKRLQHQKIDLASFNAGLNDVMNSKELAVDGDQVKTEYAMFMEKAKSMIHQETIEAGEKFLSTNGARKEVTTTDSGLQYEILKPGSGAKPTLQDKVKVHYHGTMIDGTVFDSSVERGEPISFPLGGVIQGWQEGVALMPVGSKYRLFIPYNLAYGTRGAGQIIKPYSTLIFDVELLDIEK